MVLPIQLQTEKQNPDESLDLDGLLGQIISLKDAIFKRAKSNSDKAQGYVYRVMSRSIMTENTVVHAWVSRTCTCILAFATCACHSTALNMHYFMFMGTQVFKPGSLVWLKNSAKVSKKGDKMN